MSTLFEIYDASGNVQFSMGNKRMLRILGQRTISGNGYVDINTSGMGQVEIFFMSSGPVPSVGVKQAIYLSGNRLIWENALETQITWGVF